MSEFQAVLTQLLSALEAEIVARGGKLDSIKAYSADKYANDIIESARMYWKEGIRGNFTTRMNAIIKFGLRDAFDLGAADLGMTPEDYSTQEITVRDEIIAEEKSHVADLLDYIDGLANDPTATFDNSISRLELWGARFDDVRGRAVVLLGQDAKLEWHLGETEQHCRTCSRLDGVVKRASFWQTHGILPKAPPNDMLECGGWKCDCTLEPTDKPVTRGRMPKVP
jgi:hypothetical protein